MAVEYNPEIQCRAQPNENSPPYVGAVPNPYTTTLDSVRDTLVLRARSYKWLVIAVSSSAVGACVFALIFGNAKPLLALAYLPAWVCIFLAWDQKAVQQWRANAVQFWAQGDLQFGALITMLRQVPNQPKPTMEGMIANLPEWHDTEVPLKARPALARAQRMISSVVEQTLLFRAIAWLLGASVVAAAWLLAQPFYLLVCLLLPVMLAAWAWALKRRLRLALCELRRGCADAEVENKQTESWRAQINCQGLPAGLSAAWRGVT